jgi:hypothetical protein
MATPEELYQVFVDFGTDYLRNTDPDQVNEKIVAELARVILKMDINTLPASSSDPFEQNKLDKIRDKFGVGNEHD